MSKKYLITCNLKTPNWNYIGFHTAITTLGAWWHYIDNTWIIKNSSLSAQEMYSRLAPHLSKKDFILVVEIVPETKRGWLPKPAWDWLNS